MRGQERPEQGVRPRLEARSEDLAESSQGIQGWGKRYWGVPTPSLPVHPFPSPQAQQRASATNGHACPFSSD